MEYVMDIIGKTYHASSKEHTIIILASLQQITNFMTKLSPHPTNN